MKKFLALVLALVMTMSLVTISSSADFVDADSINYDEAVNVLASLGVIQGKGGNTFDPKGGVTRAEMAKMITFIKLGVAEASAFEGTTTDLTDISGHWAESFIKFCYVEGIIAGKGAGKFDPDANVTTAEAAKMLLVALGYNASVQGYVGDSWKVSVIRDAYTSDLFEDIALSADKALNRDEAAKIIYNTVLTNVIEQKPTLNAVTGGISISYEENEGKTLLGESFKAHKFVGEMTDVSYSSVTKEYTYFDNFLGVDNAAAFEAELTGVADVASFATAEDYSDLINEQVTVIAKKPSTASKYEVLGIFSTGKTNVIEDAESAFSEESQKIKYNGALYATESVVDGDNYEINNDTVANWYLANLSSTSYDYLKFTDIDGNGKYDYAERTAVTPAKVTYVDSTELLTDKGGVFKFADDEIADGIVKGDYVASYKKSNATDASVDVVVKVEPFDSVLSAKHNKYDQVEFDGGWYNVTAAKKTSLETGSNYRVWAVNGVVYAEEKLDGASVSDLVMITGIKGGDWNNKVEYMDVNGDKYTVSVDGKGSAGIKTRAEIEDAGTGVVYRAVKTDDGVEFYAPKSVGTTYTWNASSSPYTINNDTDNNVSGIYGNKIADDAVVFVKAKDGYTVLTGSQLKGNPAANFDTILTGYYVKSKAVGLESRVSHLAVNYTKNVDDLNSVTGKEIYAFVTATSNEVFYKNEAHVRFTLWNGSENLEVYVKGTTKYSKGDVITYKSISDANVLSGVKALASDAAAVYSVEGDTVSLGANSYKITGDTKYLYINSNAKEAADIGKTAAVDLQVATTYADGKIVMDNIVYVLDGGNYELIIVDVANNMSCNNGHDVDSSADPYTDTTWAKAGDRIEFNSSVKGMKIENVLDAAGKEVASAKGNDVVYATGAGPVAVK